MNLHEHFIQFLAEWLQWAEANKDVRIPSEGKFSENYGLCVMWRKWLYQKALAAPQDTPTDPIEAARAHMRQVAIEEGIYRADGDYFDWYASHAGCPAHQWAPRLAWVRRYLAKHRQSWYSRLASEAQQLAEYTHPWYSLRISLKITEVPQDLQNLPKGWSLVETDDSSPHGLVAVFHVDHIPTQKEVHEVHQALQP